MQSIERIFLVGFMGCGKSTLGKKLANRLNFDFLDLDERIEELEKKSIDQIFEEKGENYFRKVEGEVLQQVCTGPMGIVIALGGGTPCYFDNVDLINRSGVSIYLKYNTGILISRILNAKKKRPLLKNNNKEELENLVSSLLSKREAFYSKCKHTLENKQVNLNNLVELIENIQ